jgi:hypothetical protein
LLLRFLHFVEQLGLLSVKESDELENDNRQHNYCSKEVRTCNVIKEAISAAFSVAMLTTLAAIVDLYIYICKNAYIS